MPRTKAERGSKTRGRAKISATRKMTKQEPPESDRESLQIDNRESIRSDLISMLLSNFESDLTTAFVNLNNRVEMYVEQIDQIAFEEFSVMNPSWAKKTLHELRTEKSFSASSMKSMMFETASLSKYLNSTTNITFAASKKKKPTDDEGYLTAGESGTSVSTTTRTSRTRSSSVTRASRQQQQRATSRVTRASRSLSRSKPQKNVTINAPARQTPANRVRPPMAFGMVTPKMKPNMPVSVLRRPMQGEMAISMQGSPLLVSGVVTEQCANVNIPLNDGRILSLQPSRGLRMSEIPHLDEETRKQLETLRDNLNKVVKIGLDD